MDFYVGLLKNPPWDLALLLTLVAGAFFWGASFGKKSLGFIIINLYILMALWPFIPLDSLTSGRAPIEIWAFHAGIFTLLLILLLLFMSRAFDRAGKEGVWWEILLLSIFISCFFISILISLAPQEAISKNILFLNPLTLNLFTDPSIVRLWMTIPILGVLFI